MGVWHLISATDLIVIILLFTIPKLSIIVHILRKTCCHSINDHDADFYKAIAPIYAFLLVSIPLIPYLMLMYSKEAGRNVVWLFRDNGWYGEVTKYYWHMCVYLLCSYGASCAYVFIKVGYENVHFVEQSALVNMIVLIAFIILTFPLGYALMKRSGV